MAQHPLSPYTIILARGEAGVAQKHVRRGYAHHPSRLNEVSRKGRWAVYEPEVLQAGCVKVAHVGTYQDPSNERQIINCETSTRTKP
mgnify:CR=1 FL=1